MIGKFTISDWRNLLAWIRDGIKIGSTNTVVPGGGTVIPTATLDNGIGSSQNVIELKVAGIIRGYIRTDSSGNLVLSGTGNGATFLSWDGAAGGTTFGDGNLAEIFKITNTGHLHTKGSSPTVAVNGAAGTGATASMDSGSTDAAGRIIVNCGTGTTFGQLVTVTYANAYTNHPWVIAVLSDTTGPLVGAVLYVSCGSTSSFSVYVSSALTASSQYTISYIVIGHD